MGFSYHFEFTAPASRNPGDLLLFLRAVEERAKELGFGPTLVLDAIFDTTERKRFSRRLTTGLPVEDSRLTGAEMPDDSRVWHLDRTGGTCRVPPGRGVVLVVTNEHGRETVMGFLQFPERIEDAHGRVVADTGLRGAWYFRDFVNSADPRYRELVKRFADAGYLKSEHDEYASRAT